MATDQEIRDAGYEFISPQQYLQNPFTLPTTEEEEVTETFGIPYTGAFTRSGVGGGQGGALQAGDINFNAFDQLAMGRQSKLDKGSKLSNAFYSIPGINKPQSYEDIMTHGYKEPGGAMPGIISLLNKFGVQNFASLPQADQAFIASQSGYRGPTIFGNNPGVGSQDPLGRNVESLFGNYAEAVRGDFENRGNLLGDKLADKYGAEWDDELGEYVGANAVEANKQTKMLRSMWAYDRAAINKLEGIEGEVLEGQMFRDKIYGAEGRSDPQDKSRAGALGRRPGSGGNVVAQSTGTVAEGRNTDDTGQTYDSGGKEGYGYGLKKGGRVGYRGGQLVRPGPGRPGYGGPHETYGGGVEAGRDPNPPDYSGGGDGTTKTNWITKSNIVPFINTQVDEFDRPVPVEGGLVSNTPLGQVKAMIDARKLHNALTYGKEDETTVNSLSDVASLIDPTVSWDKQFDKGNLGYKTNLKDSHVLYGSYTPTDNITLGATTDLDNYSLGATYRPNDYFTVGGTMDNTGNKYIGGELKWVFNNGGLVGIL